MKVGIIGGGISGLAAAFWLTRVEGVQVTLLEKASRLGGCIDTSSEGGYILEAAANGFLDSKPHTIQLINDAGLGHKLLRSNDAARKRFIMRYGRLLKVPDGGGAFLSTDLLTFKGKLRLIGELFVPQKKGDYDEPIGEFAVRRLGQEAADYMIDPLVSGIFAGNPAKLSLKSAFPLIYNLENEYGGLFKGLIKKPKKKKKSGPAGPGGILTSYENGLFELITDLAAKAKEGGAEIITESAIEEVVKTENGFKVKASTGEYEFDRLISTAPAYEAKNYFKPLDGELAEIMASIYYSPTFVVGLVFNENDIKDNLDGFGYLVPSKENRKILGGLYDSSIYPTRKKDGTKQIRVFLGGDTDKGRSYLDKTDEELKEAALSDIKDTVGVTGKPIFEKVFRWTHALPQYHSGHTVKVLKADAIADKIGGLYLAGNVLHGVALNDTTKRSFEVAEDIARQLGTKVNV